MCFFIAIMILFFADDNLIHAQSGSSLSLASVATTGADSVNSGGAGSQRWVALYGIVSSGPVTKDGSFSFSVHIWLQHI